MKASKGSISSAVPFCNSFFSSQAVHKGHKANFNSEMEQREVNLDEGLLIVAVSFQEDPITW